MPETTNQSIVQEFRFAADTSKSGRVLATVRIGDVFMSRLSIKPGVTTGNYYHKKTKMMFYVERGVVNAVFEHVKTKQRKLTELRPGKQVIHVPPYVALTTKNIGKRVAVLVFFSNRGLRDETDSFPYKAL